MKLGYVFLFFLTCYTKALAHQLRRHAQPQEVAQTIKFLLTESSDFITGVNLVLDGGYTLTY